MAVLTFGKAILLWCVGARKSLLNSQGFTIMRKGIIDILSHYHFEEIEWCGERCFESWQLKFENE
jgi:hypothetical protein